MLRFDRFSFDASDLRLEDDSGPIRLNHKAFDVLRVLIDARGKLVSKEQLFEEVWPGTHVSDGVLTVCITELRSALGDSASRPRFIETVHRKGYRFIAEIRAEVAAPALLGASSDHAQASGLLVGRDRELDVLDERLARALGGERQVVFVTGEPGAGKTALVDHFVAGASRGQTLAITTGQSLEHFGAREAYMPVLEAVGRLARDVGVVRPLLRRYAPTWFAQLPWLIESDDGEKLTRELLSASRERMLREMGEFLEAVTTQVPVVLVLEDLHWCDPSTVDLLSLIAARREPARLLVLATCRPVELILERHPLRPVMRALCAGRRAVEIVLDHLDADAISDFLQQRFPSSRFPKSLARRLHDRTGGNALFVITLVEDLLARGTIAEKDGEWQLVHDLQVDLAAVPDTLRMLIEQQLERLDDDDRKLLEAASLVGLSFSAIAAAAGAARATEDAEERCERLANAGSFLSHAGKAEWPDGTVAGRYAFRHALYRDTLVEGLPTLKKTEAHLRIARAFESAWGDRVGEFAATLALHFEAAADRARALRYQRLAAETARRLHAVVEAESHLESALSLLADLPESQERDEEELLLQSTLGAVRMATRGYAAPEVVNAYSRALDLSSRMADAPSGVPVLWGLWTFYVVRGELGRALELSKRAHAIAQAGEDRLMRLVGHLALATTHFFRGELSQALSHIDVGDPTDDFSAYTQSAFLFGQDQKVVALAQGSIIYWHLGRIDRALEASEEAIERARLLGHPMSIAFSLAYGDWLRLLRREPQICRVQADAVLSYAAVQGLPHWIPGALHSRGWALAEEGDLAGGIASMEEGLVRMAAFGANLGRGPRLTDLAAAKLRAGRLEDARNHIEEAKTMHAATGERYHIAELHRVEAELVLAEADASGESAADAKTKAERLLESALDVAKSQSSRTLELRAATALAKLHRRGAKAQQARTRLAECFASFDEGLDTADVREAQLLVER